MATPFRSLVTTTGLFAAALCFVLLSGSPVWSQINQQLVDKALTGSSLQHEGSRMISTETQAIGADASLGKLDGAGQLLLSAHEMMAKHGLTDMTNPLAGIIPLSADGDGRYYTEMFIRLSSDTDASWLSAEGVIPYTRIGTIVPARVPLSALRPLALHPQVAFLETSGYSYLTNDAGRADVRADRVHAGLDGLPGAFTGKGIVVGVFDSGIDFTHPDFMGADGKTRIRHLLEFLPDGSTREWDKTQIDDAPGAIPQRDRGAGQGHGTHVTGTAAGSGRVIEAHMGMAPEADIIFAKASDAGILQTHVVAGVDYIFRKAAELGKPAVVNLSLGGHFGAHDGTSLYEQSLSGLTGPGKIIVASAGNEGNDLIHAGASLNGGGTFHTIWFAESDFAAISYWYKPGTLQSLSLGIIGVVEGELQYFGELPVVGAGQSTGDNFIPAVVGGDTLGFYLIDASEISNRENGDGTALILLSNEDHPGADITNFIWVVFTRTAAAGRADMWAVTGGSFLDRGLFNDVDPMPGDNDGSIGIPATATSVISVGSYVTKTTWTDVNGANQTWAGGYGENPQIGNLSLFSSQGPTRDGRTAPIISAPGERIASALSSHLTIGDEIQASDVLMGGRYQVMQGTSMASPHVAGIVALMLEANPTLGFEQVRDALQQTARSDAGTGTVPNNRFGAGKIDAMAAMQLVAGTGATAVAAVDVSEVAMAVLPNGSTSAVFNLSNTGGAPLTFSVSAAFPAVAANVVLTGDVVGAAPPPVSDTFAKSAWVEPLKNAGDSAPNGGSALSRLNETEVQLILDDGDDSADDFVGFPDARPFYWSNGFTTPETGFILRHFDIFVRSESAANVPLYVAFEKGGQTLAQGTLTLTGTEFATGKFIRASLQEPHLLSAGEEFFLTTGTSLGGVQFPAGTDTDARAPGSSFYGHMLGEVFSGWTNLNTVTGFQDGAFIIRATGSTSVEPPAERLTVSPTSGTVSPGTSQPITVSFNAVDLLEGHYEGRVMLESNGGAPINLPVRIHVNPSVSSAPDVELPQTYVLQQNFPNPFNPATTIRFGVPDPGHATLEVFDLVGRRIATLVDGVISAGFHTAVFDSSHLSSGVYIYRLSSGTYSQTKHMVLLK